MKAVIFDLDGTLVESAPDIHAVANVLLRTNGYQPLSYETVKSFIGDGIPKLVERIMRASDIEYEAIRHADLTSAFIEFYSDNPAERTELFPGVHDVLTEFAANGIALGVCTNKTHALALQVLQAVEIEGFFSSVVGGDSLPQRKPDPAPLHECARQLGAAQVLYVGDSQVDAATAEASGIPFALFTEGYRNVEVDDLPHACAFSHFSELPGSVENIFSAEIAA